MRSFPIKYTHFVTSLGKDTKNSDEPEDMTFFNLQTYITDILSGIAEFCNFAV